MRTTSILVVRYVAVSSMYVLSSKPPSSPGMLTPMKSVALICAIVASIVEPSTLIPSKPQGSKVFDASTWKSNWGTYGMSPVQSKVCPRTVTSTWACAPMSTP